MRRRDRLGGGRAELLRRVLIVQLIAAELLALCLVVLVSMPCVALAVDVVFAGPWNEPILARSRRLLLVVERDMSAAAWVVLWVSMALLTGALVRALFRHWRPHQLPLGIGLVVALAWLIFATLTDDPAAFLRHIGFVTGLFAVVVCAISVGTLLGPGRRTKRSGIRRLLVHRRRRLTRRAA